MHRKETGYLITEYLKKALAGVLALIVAVSMTVQEANASALPAQKTVRVGYYENEVFEEGAAEGAVKKGYAYEYYLKLSEYTGWRYEYVYGSFAEMYDKLLNGEVDLLAGIAYKPEREGLIGFPELAMGNENYNLVKHDGDWEITSDPHTMNGCRIGVLKSVVHDVLLKYLEEHDVEAEVITYDDYDDLFASFEADEIDVMAAEGDGAYGKEHMQVLSTFGASDYYLCVNINRPDILEELNKAQSELAAEESNYIISLKIKYYKFGLSGRSSSASEQEWIKSHEKLRVGYLNNYLPYSDTAPDGSVNGIIKDLMPRLLESVGVSKEIIFSGYESYDDMIADMSNGNVDVAFPVGGGMYYSEESGIYQSVPVASSSTELIFSGNYNESTTSKFAVNENNKMQFYFVKSNFPDAQIVLCSSIEDCLKSVLDGKATCTTLNGLRAGDILKNREYRELSMRQLSSNDDRCFGVEIGNEGLIKLLNRGLNVLGDDYARNLAFRYTGGLYSYDFIDVMRDHMAVFGSIVLAIAILIIAFLIRDTRRSHKEVAVKENARRMLEQKNEELAKSREALARALDLAESANRAKTTFLNNMSHDIRTPMNAIVGFTSLAQSNIDDKEQVDDYLAKIALSSQHLLSLINDVLDMSRIESGQVIIDEEEVFLPDVIRDLKEIIQPNIRQKDQEFTVDLDGLVNKDIITDKLRLNQILLNILTNAVKFTQAKGSISLKVSEAPVDENVSSYEFRIKDNGIGISEEFRQNIFEAFTRERSSTVSGIQGTGLGMAITKNIVDMMGGTITVDSTEGEGSEFIVTIPCAINKNERKIKQQNGSALAFEGKRLLLAEDNELNREIAIAILEEAGLSIEVANDGSEAVKLVEDKPSGYYDAILMDIQMPIMDGYEATKLIRAMEDTKKAAIPIIAVTANAFEDDRKEAINYGMNGHLAKPYDVPRMLEMLADILGKEDKN